MHSTIGLPTVIGPTDTGNHLLPCSLTSVAPL